VFGACRARALYCSVDAEMYFPDCASCDRDLGYLGTYSADRQMMLDELLIEPARRWSHGRFVIAGPQYPPGMPAPANVERVTHIAPDAHRAFYNRLRFTLNVTRRDMVAAGYSPSVRLFEAAACATPIISDDWPGLGEFFTPEREILVARTARRVLRLLCDLPDEERAAIGQRARARVLAAHTSAHRAGELEQYVAEVRGPAAAPRTARVAATPA
jgi:spore maturation protein CgeB